MSATPVEKRLVANLKAAEEFRDSIKRDTIDPKARKFVDENVSNIQHSLKKYMEGKL